MPGVPHMTFDIVLTEDDTVPGQLIAHRPGCPAIDDHRAYDRPVLTMIGCTRPLPQHLKRHGCWGEE